MKSIQKIAIVDDTAIWRGIISSVIQNRRRKFDLVLTARNGFDFIAKLERLEEGKIPDIVILDIQMPLMNGFETAEWLVANYPTIRILAFSSSNDVASIQRMTDLNAGFLYKGASAREIADAFNLYA